MPGSQIQVKSTEKSFFFREGLITLHSMAFTIKLLNQGY